MYTMFKCFLNRVGFYSYEFSLQIGYLLLKPVKKMLPALSKYRYALSKCLCADFFIYLFFFHLARERGH